MFMYVCSFIQSQYAFEIIQGFISEDRKFGDTSGSSILFWYAFDLHKNQFYKAVISPPPFQNKGNVNTALYIQYYNVQFKGLKCCVSQFYCKCGK